MGGLAKGLAIIEAFATHGVLSVSDAARTTDITRAAARRCLITLTELGYVAQAGREFRPLPRLRREGANALPALSSPGTVGDRAAGGHAP